MASFDLIEAFLCPYPSFDAHAFNRVPWTLPLLTMARPIRSMRPTMDSWECFDNSAANFTPTALVGVPLTGFRPWQAAVPGLTLG